MTKKHIISFLTAIAANIIGIAFGQDASQTLPGTETAYYKPVVKPASGALRLNEVHSKAVRSFNCEYKDATDAKWYHTADGFVVYFKYKDVDTKVFYNKRGNHDCTVRYYNERVLPREVRHNVRSRYYDHNIYHVVEVSAAGTTGYLIKLEGKNSWMDIRVLDNEIDVLKEYTKL
jgi:hypothetical protein